MSDNKQNGASSLSFLIILSIVLLLFSVSYLLPPAAPPEIAEWLKNKPIKSAKETITTAVDVQLENGRKIHDTGYNGTTLMRFAILDDRLDVIQWLVSNGASLDNINIYEESALYGAVHAERFDIIEWIIQCGVNVNKEDSLGDTPMSIAVARNNMKIMELLHANGARINNNSEAHEYSRPLMHTATLSSTIKTMQWLKDKGEKLESFDQNGVSPMYIAIEKGFIRKIRWLNNNGVNMDVRDRFGETPLHRLAFECDTKIMQLLKDSHVYFDVNAKDRMGRTPLFYSLSTPENLPNGRYSFRLPQSSYDRRESARWLISNGADVNLKDNKGNSPLLWAIQSLRNSNIHEDMTSKLKATIKLLIESGANVNAENGNGETPIDLTRRHHDIVELLTRNGAIP